MIDTRELDMSPPKHLMIESLIGLCWLIVGVILLIISWNRTTQEPDPTGMEKHPVNQEAGGR